MLWDDWGGWFDPVPPAFKDYDGLGFRVPLLMVSPYAKHGYVTHVQYETASVLRYIEDNFGLPPMAAATRAPAILPATPPPSITPSRRAIQENWQAQTRRRIGCESSEVSPLARTDQARIIGDD